MKNSRKAWIIFRRILFILFIIFLVNYYQVESGNYKTEVTKKTIITNEKIKEFEEDVKNGKNIDVKNYVEETCIDTRNKTGKLGNIIGSSIENFINYKGKIIFDFIRKLFI